MRDWIDDLSQEAALKIWKGRIEIEPTGTTINGKPAVRIKHPMTIRDAARLKERAGL